MNKVFYREGRPTGAEKGNLEKQSHGIFSVDGTLSISAQKKYLAYVYYYRNQFLILDSSLNIIVKGNTIDTTTSEKIKVVKINSDNVLKIANPTAVINKSSCIAGKYLLVNSVLRADNENKNWYDRSSTIDVYSLKTAKYLFSFHLPDINNSKVTSLKAINNILVVTYKNHYLASFKMNFNN